MLNDAKDEGFLAKLQQTLANRKKLESMKTKDREMRYKHMMQRLEEQRKERVYNIKGVKPKSTTNKAPYPEQGLIAGAA